MKVYIHECADDTTLLFSDEGRVLGVYSDYADAQSDYYDYPIADEGLEGDELLLDFESDHFDFDSAA